MGKTRWHQGESVSNNKQVHRGVVQHGMTCDWNNCLPGHPKSGGAGCCTMHPRQSEAGQPTGRHRWDVGGAQSTLCRSQLPRTRQQAAALAVLATAHGQKWHIPASGCSGGSGARNVCLGPTYRLPKPGDGNSCHEGQVDPLVVSAKLTVCTHTVTRGRRELIGTWAELVPQHAASCAYVRRDMPGRWH